MEVAVVPRSACPLDSTYTVQLCEQFVPASWGLYVVCQALHVEAKEVRAPSWCAWGLLSLGCLLSVDWAGLQPSVPVPLKACSLAPCCLFTKLLCCPNRAEGGIMPSIPWTVSETRGRGFRMRGPCCYCCVVHVLMIKSMGDCTAGCGTHLKPQHLGRSRGSGVQGQPVVQC